MTKKLAVTALAASLCAGAFAFQDNDDAHPGEQYAKDMVARMTDPGAMQAWQDSMQPSQGHKVLALLEGEWDANAKMWMSQDAPPMEEKWEATNTVIMGGRFVEHKASGQFMGMPVESMIILGYDNVRSLFHAAAYSSLGTGFNVSWGNLDQTGKILTFVGEMDEPMSGEIGKPFKAVWYFDDADTIRYEVYEILYGEPFRVIEVTMTRKE